MIPGVKRKKFSGDIELWSNPLTVLTEVTEADIQKRPISALTDESTRIEDKEIKYFIKVNDEYQAMSLKYKQDALVLGVRQGNEAQVQQLLMLQTRRKDSIDTSLWFACKNNDVSIAELLLDNGAFPGYTVCGTSCIHLSALHGATSLILSFLKKYTQLSTIRMQKSILLEVTPDRPFVEFPEGAIPVHMCVFGRLSSLPLLEALLDQSEVDIRDANERTPLMYACKGGNCFSVRALLLKGADIEHKCKEGKTSLLYAAANGDYSVLELLIKRNACLVVRDIEKKGIFAYAKDEEVANTILGCTANFFEESAVELLPIRELITKGYHQTQKRLLDSMVTTPQEDRICIDLGQLELEPPDCERKEKLLNIIAEQSPDLPLFDSIVLRSYAEHHMNR